MYVYSPGNWDEGEKVVVCSAIKENGITGLTPLPNGAVLRTKVTMRIEEPQTTGVGSTYNADTDPTGQGWTPWC